MKAVKEIIELVKLNDSKLNSSYKTPHLSNWSERNFVLDKDSVGFTLTNLLIKTEDVITKFNEFALVSKSLRFRCDNKVVTLFINKFDWINPKLTEQVKVKYYELSSYSTNVMGKNTYNDECEWIFDKRNTATLEQLLCIDKFHSKSEYMRIYNYIMYKKKGDLLNKLK